MIKLTKKEDIANLPKFLIEQFFEKEVLQQTFNGIDEEKAKILAEKTIFYDLEFCFKYGDIFVYDEEITSIIVGMKSKKMSFIKQMPFIIKAYKELKILSKNELDIITKNSKIVNEVHSTKWFRKHFRNSYYLIQFAVDKNKRGHGIARKMLENLFTYAEKENDYIVLETLTESNIAIYEHFGFKIVEKVESKNKKLTEYRMVKYLNKNI